MHHSHNIYLFIYFKRFFLIESWISRSRSAACSLHDLSRAEARLAQKAVLHAKGGSNMHIVRSTRRYNMQHFTTERLCKIYDAVHTNTTWWFLKNNHPIRHNDCLLLAFFWTTMHSWVHSSSLIVVLTQNNKENYKISRKSCSLLCSVFTL